MKTKRIVISALMTLVALNLEAIVLTWYGDGTTSGGSGPWNTSDARWHDGTGVVAWNNSGGHTAAFGGTSAGTVTLGAAITAQDMVFSTPNYVLVGSYTLTLDSGGVNVNLAANQVASVGVALAGGSGLTKTGTGILALTAAGSYSGDTAIQSGIVRLEVNNAFSTLGILDIASGAQFNLYRGTGANTAGNERYSQTVAGLTGGGMLRFGQNTTIGNPGVLTVNVPSATTRTFSGTVNTSATGGSRRAAVLKEGDGTQVWSPGAADLSYTDLRVNGGTFRLGTGNVGGYINLSGNAAGALDLNGVSKAFDTTAGAILDNTGETLSMVEPMFNGKTWSSAMRGNIRVRQTQDFTYYGGNNSFTSGIQLDSGGFRFNSVSTVPSNCRIQFNGGRFEFGQSNNGVYGGGVFPSDRAFEVTANGGAFRGSTTSAAQPTAVTIRGAIDDALGVTAPGILRFHAFGTGSQANNATYTLEGGGTFSGRLVIGDNTANPSSFTLRPGAANGLPTGAALGFVGASGTTQTLNLNGFGQRLAGLTNAASGYTARVVNTGASAATLTLESSQSFSFNGKLGDTGGTNFALTKRGSGTQILVGTAMYVGATRIEGGQLLIDGTTSGQETYTVANGGTLGGGGTIGLSTGRKVVVESGGAILADASGADMLTIQGDLDLSTVADILILKGEASGDALLVTYTGSLLGRFDSVQNLPDRFSVSYTPSGQIHLRPIVGSVVLIR